MKRVIAYMLMILMGIQIVLGALYFLANFEVMQDFPEGFSFPLSIGVLSLIQMAAFAASTWFFLTKSGMADHKFLRGFITAFLLTVPFLLQMHMANLWWSFSLSAFLCMAGLAMETGREGFSRKQGILLGTFYFLYGLLCPDGLWLGGVLLIAALLFYRRMDVARFIPSMLVAACLIFAVNAGLNAAWPDGRETYRYNTFSYALVQRFVWPNFSTHYYFWNEDVKAVMSLDDAVEISHRVDAVERDFFPALEQSYGRKRAKQLCMQMAGSCLEYRTREIAEEIAADFKDYLLIPFTIERNLRGKGASLTGWNYERINAHTPKLVKYYYRYALLELPLLLLGSILLWSFRRGLQLGGWMKTGRIEETHGWNISPEWKLLIFTGVFYAAWYTMKSNIPIDYKQVMPVLFIWYLAAVQGLVER